MRLNGSAPGSGCTTARRCAAGAASPHRRLRSVTAAAAVILVVAGGCTPDDETATPTEPAATATIQVEVFFSNDRLGDPCDEVFGVLREVESGDPVTGAMAVLLQGPSADEAESGYSSWFSDATSGMLNSVRVTDATAYVDLADLRPVIPGASSSCGSTALLAQLDTTLFDVAPEAEAIVYSLDGDVAAFYEWLQRDPPAGWARDEDAPDDREPQPEAPDEPGGAHTGDDRDESATDDGEHEDEPSHDATDLDDGRHPAYLHALDVQARTITVDVIQFLTGQEAIDAHDRDHPDEPGGPPNDYYILNTNPRLRQLAVSDDVQVGLVRLEQDGDADVDPGTWEELPDYLARTPSEGGAMSWNPYWITLRDGEVVAIEEQYVP